MYNEENNLINYLKEKNNNKYLDSLKYNLGKKIYYYGEQFKNNKLNFINIIRNILIFIIASIINRSNKKELVLSSAYLNYDDHIEKKDYCVERICGNQRLKKRSGCNIKILLKSNYIEYCLGNKDFKYLLSSEMENLINSLKIDIYNYIKEKNYRALFVPNDLDFFMKIYIDAFKSLNKPTFLLAHGGIYNIYDLESENRTDYIVVWGNAQKKAFIENGYNKKKFFVSGHPNYKFNNDLKITSSTNNILVLTKSLVGVPQYYELEDRGSAIVYLLGIKEALKKIGVPKVRLRLHPSENINFYKRFLDDEFFIHDDDDIDDSLNKSTMVIGPRSTVIVDAIFKGINYIVYEPKFHNKDIFGHRITAPMDGSLDGLNISRSQSELFNHINENRIIDKNVFIELCGKKFDDSFINIINEL